MTKHAIKTNPKTILLTVDVEDWFQVENFKQWIPFDTWDSRELRVEKNTHRLLDLFDAVEVGGEAGRPRATFFVLGWVAERLPGLVREIHERGHEVASHGVDHELCNRQSAGALRDDLIESRRILEDLIGAPMAGYRAPSFSIDDDVLKVIEESGFLYDSSFNSFAMHGRYGSCSACSPGRPESHITPISESFYELPVSNMEWGGRVIPWGGGGYFRLIPSPLFRLGVKHILQRTNVYLFYMHPWEFDPGQPRVNEASLFFKFRHYNNLESAFDKLAGMIRYFSACDFTTCGDYLKSRI